MDCVLKGWLGRKFAMRDNANDFMFRGSIGIYVNSGFDTVAAIVLSAVLGLNPASMHLHREDPNTTYACPRKNVKKLEVIQEVQDWINNTHGESI